MKKLFKVVAVAVLSLGFGIAANAQTTDNKIVASATVVDVLKVEAGDALSFGQVSRGIDKYVPMTGAAESGESSTSQSGVSNGYFRVFAGVGANVNLTFSALTVLKNGDEELKIDFNKGLSPTGVENTIAYGTTGASPTLVPMTFGSNTIASFPENDINGSNGVLVYVGGTVRPSQTQVSGTYTGDIILTATYN